MSLSGFSPTWVAIALTKMCGSDPKSPPPDTPPLQIHDAVDTLMREQFVAAHMHAAEHIDGFSLVDLSADSNGKRGSELDEVHLTAPAALSR